MIYENVFFLHEFRCMMYMQMPTKAREDMRYRAIDVQDIVSHHILVLGIKYWSFATGVITFKPRAIYSDPTWLNI